MRQSPGQCIAAFRSQTGSSVEWNTAVSEVAELL
jgi:hypothetical protein